MSFVAIDLGASSSRVTSDPGQICIVPNNIVGLLDGQTTKINPDATDIESSLEVHITKTSGEPCEYFPANILAGIIADRYSTLQERPSVNVKKYAQPINYISAIMSAAIARLKYETPENIWLYLAVPPIEIHEAREVFNKKLVGTYTVDFPKYMGGTTVALNVQGVKCYEESCMASTSFFFNMNGIPKEQHKKYLTGTVLSIDIGASTTDLAIIKNGRYLDKSGKTYRIGGNEARDRLYDDILAKFDIDLDVESVERCMAEGRLQRGNTYEDISELISHAKSSLAKKLTAHMQTYFKMVNIDLNTINAIIVSGGGSMQSQYVNDDGEVVKVSEPMSYFVTEELTQISKGTEIVFYGDEARLANIKGLFIRAKLDSTHNQPAPKTPVQTPAQAPVQTPAQAPVQTPAQAPVQTPAQAPVQTPAQAPVQTPETAVAESNATTSEATEQKEEDTQPTVKVVSAVIPNIKL